VGPRAGLEAVEKREISGLCGEYACYICLSGATTAFHEIPFGKNKRNIFGPMRDEVTGG
jgi:hypothetical protein